MKTPKWNPTSHPFIVRALFASSQRGNYGWTEHVIGHFETYDDARTFSDRPMRRGEISTCVVQAINPENWSRKGRWRTCFERKRGGKITEPGPLKSNESKVS